MRALKFLTEFEKMIRRHSYIFHVHTDFTDGASSVEDYCRFALNKSFKYLIFTEHIRQVCNYDFADFAYAVENARYHFPLLRIALGVEVKVLPGGNLDISEEILERIDLLGIACHSFPSQLETYVESMEQAFKRYHIESLVRIWLHPGLFFERVNIADAKVFAYLLHLAIEQGVYIEHNIKYGLPPVDAQAQVPPQRKVVGVDAHSVRELEGRIPELVSVERSFRKELMESEA